jgi:thiosulfate/3-mercaptopyruvate sulfurtransferase
MRRIYSILALSLVILGSVTFFSFRTELPGDDDPWEASQLMDPAKLASIIKDPKAKKPVIINVGPMDNIKGAVYTGVGSTQEGIDKFKAYVDKLPLEKDIVIYCGCCKLGNCPNIKKTFLYLNARGYTNHKLLNIPTSLEDDWVKKGYPVAQ